MLFNIKIIPHIVVMVLIASTLTGCQSIPKKKIQNTTKIAQVLGIEEQQITHSSSVTYGVIGSADTVARLRQGIYVQTATHIYIARYSKDSQDIFKDVQIPISKISYSGIAVWGMFNHLYQIRLHINQQALVINYGHTSDAIAGYEKETMQAVRALKTTGLNFSSNAPRTISRTALRSAQNLPLIITN